LMSELFNPFSEDFIFNAILSALKQQPLLRLERFDQFQGGGVYAIYPRRSSNPIYVGQATKTKTALYQRLKDHRRSIRSASNLDIRAFRFRYMVCAAKWISLIEAFLIERLSPEWNESLIGFGNRRRGKNRSGQRVSDWDQRHPGRCYRFYCRLRVLGARMEPPFTASFTLLFISLVSSCSTAAWNSKCDRASSFSSLRQSRRASLYFARIPTG
jgi:hypothetical protein